MFAFATFFNSRGFMLDVSGLSRSRKIDGTCKSDVIGKHASEFAADKAKHNERLKKLLDGAKPIAYQHEDEKGQWWAARMFSIPRYTRVVTFCSTLPNAPATLTEREHQILRWMCDDISGSEITQQLGISSSAFRTCMQVLREKVGVRTNFGLVRYAMLNGYSED